MSLKLRGATRPEKSVTSQDALENYAAHLKNKCGPIRPKVTVSELDQEGRRVVRLLLGVAVGRLVEFFLPFARLHVRRSLADVEHDGACNTRGPPMRKVWDCRVVGRARRRQHLRLIPQSSMALLNRAERERGERVGRPGHRRACALNAAKRALVHYLLYYTGGLHYL